MATSDEPSDSGTAMTQVELTLFAHGNWDEEALERDAMRMLEAVEQGADGALGPVVAWNNERGAIELEFTVAALGSEVHRVNAAVMQIVERELPLREVESHTASGALACA